MDEKIESRKTDACVVDILKSTNNKILTMIVSEAETFIYSVSKLAVTKLLGLDVSLRKAVFIAHRLQNVLAKLVALNPKSIDMGQYQHNINQKQLAKCLDAAVKDCVSIVNIDINSVSAALLTLVTKFFITAITNIIEFHGAHRQFGGRKILFKILRLGPKSL
ncbi:Tex family protein [Candidatus Enterovibrio altilux]|uniref:hypothetical protein n=1 Tax=Candidatus Enterovibrio altilux TaxID=1927128 RepID=UPI002110B607|nr:hypothetical protein [Candidatus Enterovibrio luxaltus]